MFDWNLFALLIVICLPGIALTVPRTLRSVQGLIETNLKPGQAMPPFMVLVLMSSLQALLLVALAAAVGTATMASTGLEAPFLEALSIGELNWSLLGEQVWAGLIGALICMGPFLAAYYGYFRPNLDAHTVEVTESLRSDLGLLSRILYGGVYEEVLVRWGLMGLIVWIGTLLLGSVTAMGVWLAIVLAGILFAYGHLPGSYAAGAKKSLMLIAATLGLNGWASIVFGFLFWQSGLTAAIVAHMLLHLIWYPIEQVVRNKV